VGAPSGTVTFLFTDIEGSTRVWEAAPEQMGPALAIHDAIVRGAIDRHGGWVFSTGGDGFGAAFARAGDAVAAASDAQAELGSARWPAGAAARVRMGLHTGEVEERDGNYFGPAVNRAARLMAIGHGGQVLCSQVTAALVGPMSGLRNLGEHRLRDLGAAEVVFQVGGGSFPPLRSVDVVPTNLPTVRTELIGRADHIAALSTLVAHEQLVTLTGVGGVGKTRLALGVAAALSHRFADGCWLVELAPVTDGGEVAKAVAAAMGTPLTDRESLVAYLADRRVLIVLDNCEHVVAHSAELVDAVLGAAPDVRVVATSREPLGVDGEKVYRVGSLAVPPTGAPAGEAAAAPAVRLFADRAAAVSQRFAVEPGNVTAVVDICRHLDGIPLAIELAAARVRAMPPAEIAARLGERFRILGGGSRRAQERHRTLLATVSWSHDLLDDDEKAVFRRLAVFPSSFDLAAAEAVAGDGGLDVLDTVVRLVDRSLVQYEPEVGRYRLLETLRQYGSERLSDAGETDTARERHARHYLELAEGARPELESARYPVAHDRLLGELDNLRATAEWCIDGGRWAELWALARPLWPFLFQAAPADGVSWYRELADHAGALDPRVVVDALGAMAALAVESFSDFPYGTTLAEHSIALAERERVAHSPWAWIAVTQAAMLTTHDPEGLAACEQALAAAEARDDELAAIIALGLQANWLAFFGDAEGCARTSADAVRRAERTGHPVHLQMAVVTAATSLLFQCAPPDFAAALAVLAGHDELAHLDDAAIWMWHDIAWANALVGLHRAEAVPRLARAVRIADSQSILYAVDHALRLLAVAASEAGHEREADMLAGYSEACLSAHRMPAPGFAWIQAALDRALGAPDRAAQRAAGAGLTRYEMLAIVNDLEAGISGA
jgi:predicted ATPase/class 3 adenylate cyclase